jgi:hypothetical protein
VGLVAAAGVVETQAIVAAASGQPRGGRAAVAGSVAAGSFAAERGGRATGTPERGLWPRGGRCLLRGLSRPELIAALDEVLRAGSLKSHGLIRFLMWGAAACG